MSHSISIICPIYNEEKYIEKCINSILAQDYPQEKMELLLIDGMSTDHTREIINKIIAQYSFISLHDNIRRIAPAALNYGIKIAKGEVIIRIDAHSTYPTNYVSTLVDKLFELNADNVGGLCKTLPTSNTSQSKAVAIVSSHRFGVGNALFRVGVNTITKTDTVPFGCFRADLFKRIGCYKEHLLRSEDDELNARITNNGGSIYLIPDLEINYYARDTISKMAKMFYQYGLFKPLANKELGKPATIRQFFPLAFLLGIVFGGVLSLFFRPIMCIYCTVLLVYLLLVLCFSAQSSIKHKDLKLLIIMPITFLAIHLSYGWGYLMGIIKFILLGKTELNVKVNR